MNLSDDEIQKSYDEKKPTLERAKARHILIAFKGSPAAQKDRKELTEDEAKAKAEGIRTKLVAGADFAAIAKAESDDTGSAARGGDLGSFSRGQMVPEFDAAVFEGKVGEISPVVRTQYGFHVIQVQERGPAPLTEVKPQIEQELKQKKLQEKVDAMKDAARVTFDDTYFAPPAPKLLRPRRARPSLSRPPRRKSSRGGRGNCLEGTGDRALFSVQSPAASLRGLRIRVLDWRYPTP